MNLCLRCTQVTEEADIVPVFVEIFVFPFPLITGDQYIQLCIVVVVDIEQGGGGRYSHCYKNEERHYRPYNLYFRALVKRRGRNTP